MTAQNKRTAPSQLYFLAYLAWSLPGLALLTAPVSLEIRKWWANVLDYPFRVELAQWFEWILWSLLLSCCLGLWIVAARLIRVKSRGDALPNSDLFWYYVFPPAFWAYSVYPMLVIVFYFPYAALIVLVGLGAIGWYGSRRLDTEQSRRVAVGLALVGLVPASLIISFTVL